HLCHLKRSDLHMSYAVCRMQKVKSAGLKGMQFNFHAFALCQYLHSFYFLALFDYEIACPLVQLISLFAFYKLHNSYVNRSFLGGTNVRHFCSFPAITSM